jgi:hypothetical protein
MRERERERERRKESVNVTQMGSQGWASPAWVAVQQRMPNQLARHPHAKWWAPQAVVGGVPGAVPATS